MEIYTNIQERCIHPPCCVERRAARSDAVVFGRRDAAARHSKTISRDMHSAWPCQAIFRASTLLLLLVMAAHGLGLMLSSVPVRHGVSLLARSRAPMHFMNVTRVSALTSVAMPRYFSLGGQSSYNNEAARQQLFSQAQELKNVSAIAFEEGKETSSSALEEVKHLGQSVQERVSHANEAVTSTLSQDADMIHKASDFATNDLQAHGLGGWTPSGMLQHLLDGVQYLTDLPWWATIILVTCGIRLAIAPLLVYVQGNSIRLSNIQPQMQSLLKELQYAKSMGNQQEMQVSAMKVRKLLADNNASPFKSLLLPVVQMPIFLSFYFALNGLAKAPLPALTTGGVAWFPDLTAADPYYVLPILSSAMTLLVLETGAETGTTGMNQTPQARMIKNVLRGVTVLAAWFISSFPSAVLLYWTTTNTFSLVQLLALRTRFFKRLLRLPEKIEHPVQPHVKQKSFMEGIREGMGSNARPATPVRRPPPPSALRKAQETPQTMSQTRSRALDSLMTEGGASKASATTDAAREASSLEKQSRVAAARERRLRQRS